MSCTLSITSSGTTKTSDGGRASANRELPPRTASCARPNLVPSHSQPHTLLTPWPHTISPRHGARERSQWLPRRNFTNDTVDDALSLMSALRHKGVRAHFWI